MLADASCTGSNEDRRKMQNRSLHSIKCTGGTLCWTCAKNTGFCSWSASFTPVEGWEAVLHPVANAYGQPMESYHVIKCPQFVKAKEAKR